MFKKNWFLFLLACLPLFGIAQSEEATTKSGKKVILYPDGTWKYAEEVKTDTREVKEVKLKPEEKKKEKEEVKKTVSPVTTAAPECANEVDMSDDSRTGMRTWRTRNMIIVSEPGGTKEIGLLIQKNSKGILTVFFRPVGAGDCIGEGNKINIVFMDGSKLELTHDNPMNCRGESAANFGGNWGRKKQVEELRSKTIKSIKVWTQQGSVMQTLSAENAEQFRKMFSCLAGQ